MKSHHFQDRSLNTRQKTFDRVEWTVPHIGSWLGVMVSLGSDDVGKRLSSETRHGLKRARDSIYFFSIP